MAKRIENHVTRNGLLVSFHPTLEAEEKNSLNNLSAPTQSGITPSIQTHCQPIARLSKL